MGKEPAGLRRWRLAHKKKRRVRRLKQGGTVRRRRSYGRKRKGGRKGKGAIPIIQAAMIAYPVYDAYKAHGISGDLPGGIVIRLTGYNVHTNKLESPQTAVAMGLGLLIMSTLGAKIANRTGANRFLKKFSAGMLKLA
jgi:uncharacterized membrane protein YfcA